MIDLTSDYLDSYAASVRAVERERCAKIAENIKLVTHGHPQIDAPNASDAMRQIAAAIRAQTQ